MRWVFCAGHCIKIECSSAVRVGEQLQICLGACVFMLATCAGQLWPRCLLQQLLLLLLLLRQVPMAFSSSELRVLLCAVAKWIWCSLPVAASCIHVHTFNTFADKSMTSSSLAAGTAPHYPVSTECEGVRCWMPQGTYVCHS